MGLLRDYLIKDPVMKRKVTMIMTIAMIIGLVVSVFIPQVMDMAYQQGKNWAKEICMVTEDDLLNENISIGGLYGGMGLEKNP